MKYKILFVIFYLQFFISNICALDSYQLEELWFSPMFGSKYAELLIQSGNLSKLNNALKQQGQIDIGIKYDVSSNSYMIMAVQSDNIIFVQSGRMGISGLESNAEFTQLNITVQETGQSHSVKNMGKVAGITFEPGQTFRVVPMTSQISELSNVKAVEGNSYFLSGNQLEQLWFSPMFGSKFAELELSANNISSINSVLSSGVITINGSYNVSNNSYSITSSDHNISQSGQMGISGLQQNAEFTSLNITIQTTSGTKMIVPMGNKVQGIILSPIKEGLLLQGLGVIGSGAGTVTGGGGVMLGSGETLEYLVLELNYGSKVATLPYITSSQTTYKAGVNGALSTGVTVQANLSISGSNRQATPKVMSGGTNLLSSMSPATFNIPITSGGTGTATTSDTLTEAYVVYQTNNMDEAVKDKLSISSNAVTQSYKFASSANVSFTKISGLKPGPVPKHLSPGGGRAVDKSVSRFG